MKIAIIGGGPAGLYSAILLRKQRPEAEITVYERNRADDTFGFGVVFSDATLDNFEKYDSPSYRRITQEFAYWDDIAVHFRGTAHRVGGNGVCGWSRRQLLFFLRARGAPGRRQRVLRLLASQAAFDPAGAGARTRRGLAVRSRCRRRGSLCRCRSGGVGRGHQTRVSSQNNR